MPSKASASPVQVEKPHDFPPRAARPKLRDADDAFDALARDALGDDVDQSPDRAAAVNEGRRPPQDLDLGRADRFGRDPVIGADRGDIHHPEPVFQHPHPRRVEAADHEARGTAAHAGGMEARLPIERVAEARRLAPAKRVAREHARRLNDRGFVAIEWRDVDGIRLRAGARGRGGKRTQERAPKAFCA